MKMRKGIILAGGYGKRLYPLTLSVSKQLLPIYSKPMIYYPLYVLMTAKIKEILLITTPKDKSLYENLLGDGSEWGIKIEYKVQQKPNGLAEAFILGEEFIGKDEVVLILGDNIFYGEIFLNNLSDFCLQDGYANIFCYYVDNPSAYGVVEFDEFENAISIEEKPKIPKSNYIATGLYFYPNDVINYAKKVEKSARGELEITSINEEYLKNKKLKVQKLDDETIWFDTGTPDSLLSASNFVMSTEKKLNKLICCPEEIAYKNGWISSRKLQEHIQKYEDNMYKKFLNSIEKDEIKL